MEECDEVCSLAQPQEDLHQRLQNQNYRGMMFVRLVHKPASLMNNISAPKNDYDGSFVIIIELAT